jgi:trehalose 6-phosphate phosphatase
LSLDYLFSAAGLHRLDAVVRPGVLCAFDFDGTLAPIVTQPDKACLAPGVLKRLNELSAYAPVAILTGRSVADIRTRLGFAPDFIVGNHGLEGVPGWEARASAYNRLCQEWTASLAAALQNTPSIEPGICIENKDCSLSVHYRLARDRAKCERQLSALFEELSPRPRIVHGKCVFSLLPETTIHKGTALEQLIGAAGASRTLYVGDDVTDEDVFRLNREDLLSIRIERTHHSAAACYLYDRLEMTHLLDDLLLRLRRLQGSGPATRSAAAPHTCPELKNDASA